MNICTVRSRVIATEIGFNSSSMFGICGLILVQLSFSLRESRAIFTVTTAICRSSQLLLRVIQNSPRLHPLFFPSVRFFLSFF